jgi:anti-anti-sigma factor
MAGTFSVEVEQRVETCVLRCRGELDIESGEHLASLLEIAGGDGRRAVVVDLTEVGFMDSTGVNVLLGAHRLMEASGKRLAVRGASSTARRVFAITRVDEIIHLE